jgi:hypothetical protein
MKSISFSLFAILLLSACTSSLKVTTDYDKNASFSQYKTFSLVSPIDDKHRSVSPLNQQRINNSVVAELTRKGFAQNDGTPDLMVSLAVIVKNKQNVSAYTDYYGYGGYYRPWGWGGVGMGTTYTTYNVQNYKEGSLIIDIADAKTKNLVWEGVGNKEIDGPVQDPDAAIQAAVSKIMASFPPGGAGTGK